MLVASAFQWRAAAALAVGLAFAAPNPAKAALIWDWAFSGTDINASGTFTTSDTPDEAGYYLITGISGSRNGVAITGLQPAGTPIPGNEPYAVDDLVSVSGPQLTVSGFGFSLADGTYSNPFYANFLSPPGYLEFYSAAPFTSTIGPEDSELPVGFTAALTSVPEPGTLSLTLVGLIGLVTVGIWRCSGGFHGHPGQR